MACKVGVVADGAGGGVEEADGVMGAEGADDVVVVSDGNEVGADSSVSESNCLSSL
jgi:hypothetical protein